jgi:actin cytoskeleton-regulatory complex protein SLA1
LALKDGKINLHKMNGVKIAVPVAKMSIEDLEYVERITGQSLDEDKPLDRRQKSRPAGSESASSNTGATVERPKKPEYDWFQFFLSCDVAVGLCEHYSQTFNRDSMDESVLPDVDATVLRTLGIREGDIIKIMRYLDKKYGRTGGKRSVSFSGEDTPDGESPGGLFSGPGGTLRNNTSRKSRPAPAVQTSDVVDAKAFSQDTPKSAVPEGVATPLTSVPVPEKKDVVRTGFDDNAWDVKPGKQQPATSSQQSQPAPAPTQPALTGSMHELSLLSAPLQPVKAQVTAPPSQPAVNRTSEQQGPPPVTPSIFQGIGQQQTGLPLLQQNTTPIQTNLPQNIARQRPAPPPFPNQGQPALALPPTPSRPLSAPQANQASSFPLPPLQSQSTGFQNSSGFQQIAPPGQSLEEMRMRQQYTGFNGPQNGYQNVQNMQNMQNMNMMPQPTEFQYNGMQQPNQQPNGFQYPMQSGIQQQQPMNVPGPTPFANPEPQQFAPLQQQHPTGFQSSFGQQPQQQFPHPTGINSYLPPPLQPTPTGVQNPGYGSTFTPPPVPPIPQQPVAAPLTPQKTGPPPPVRFGVTGDTKKLMPQATGRRANLSQASEYNRPAVDTRWLIFRSSAKSLRFLGYGVVHPSRASVHCFVE